MINYCAAGGNSTMLLSHDPLQAWIGQWPSDVPQLASQHSCRDCAWFSQS